MIIFPRYVGRYSFNNLYRYFVPYNNPKDRIKNYLPNSDHICFFGQARHGLLEILRYRKRNTDKSEIIIPNWTCSIIKFIARESNFNIKELEIDKESLHYSEKAKYYIKKNYNKIDLVILIAENGNVYSQNEIDFFRSYNISVVLDYSLALPNYDIIKNSKADYFLFSGGFSKPISSVELGIVVSNNDDITGEKFINRIRTIDIIKIFIHLMIQNNFIYNLSRKLYSKTLTPDSYDRTLLKPNIRSLSVLLSNIYYFEMQKINRITFQLELYRIFKHYNVTSTLLKPAKIIYSKIIIYDIKYPINSKIEFHYQYAHNPNYRKLSFSINNKVLKNSQKFLTELEKIIKNTD